MSADSLAEDMLRAGYERWLRLEEEKDAIGEDLKELFAELKGNGFTPKALRESFRRVRNINDANQREHDAVVDLYVAALTGARPARTREDDIPHDADGVVIEDEEIGTKAPASKAEVVVSAAEEINSSTAARKDVRDNSTGGGARAELTDPAAAITLPAGTQVPPVETPVPQHAAEEADEGEVTPPVSSADIPDYASDVTPEAVQVMRDQAAPFLEAGEFEVISEPASPPSEIAEPGDRGAVVPSAAPVVADNSNIPAGKKRWTFNDPAHPDCLDTAMCGGFSNLKLCQRCREAAAVGQVA